jgi:dTDP-4-dehydrorhamnose 3,5-epimerase-like enzyme
MSKPRIIKFQIKGNDKEGFLNIATSATEIPFNILRSFWAQDTPEGVIRGRHAHYETEMVLIAIKGSIEVKTISSDGQEMTFVLSNSDSGLYLPKLCWHEMTYSPSAIQLVFTNTIYEESDYIRNKSFFLNLIHQANTTSI